MPTEGSDHGSDEALPLVLDRLTAADLPQALALSLEMNWPYRLEDWAFALSLGHGLALKSGSRVVATGAWWANGDAFATVGMIIVSTALQGRGLGARLFDAVMAETAGRTLLLNSTAEGLELYRRRGFMTVGDIHQHQGILQLRDEARLPGVRLALASDLDAIVPLDEAAAGRPRGELLAALAREARFVVLERGGELKGYAASRPFGRGHVVGPVIAADGDEARALIAAAAADLAGAFVRLDTSPDLGLGPWLAAQGLAKVSTATTMVRGAPPARRAKAQVFALSSQSLG